MTLLIWVLIGAVVIIGGMVYLIRSMSRAPMDCEARSSCAAGKIDCKLISVCDIRQREILSGGGYGKA